MRVLSTWKTAGWLAAAAAVAIVPVVTLSGPASASGPGPNTRVAVSGGINVAALPHATVFGTVTPQTAETVAIVLKTNDTSQLEAAVEGGASHFLTTAQFAATYGQTTTYIGQLQSYLRRFGIATNVYADHLDVHATGTAGEFDRAFTVRQENVHVPAQSGSASSRGGRATRAQNVHSPASSPLLPEYLAQNVQAIVGLSNYSPYVSDAVHAKYDKTPKGGTTSVTSCLAGPEPAGCHTPSFFASTYGLDGLYAKGAEGQGQTIGIVTLAPLNATTPTYFWHTVLHLTPSGRTVTVDDVDGGPAVTLTGSGETDLDVQQSGAVAPDADIVVYQAPDSTEGFADAFFTAATANVASDVSVSWGESETIIQYLDDVGALTSGYVGALDEAYMELAMQGQSAFDASGDTGAYDANRTGPTTLSVDNPASSPYITAAGGTTTPFSEQLTNPATGATATVKVSAQRTWGWDWLWPAIAALTGVPLATVATTRGYVIGSGGGYSTLEPEPSYQRGVTGVQQFSDVEYLTPTDYQTAGGLRLPFTWSFDPRPRVGHGTSNGGRAVPDLAADADPFSGYLLYAPTTLVTSAGNPLLEGGWGGTSFVGPQMNGATAVIDSALGHRVGFWNPQIYAFATEPSSPFTPLDQSGTSNDNLYYTGTPGAVYNPGSGLGTPDLTALEADFAHVFGAADSQR